MEKYIFVIFMFLSYSFISAQEKELKFSMQEAIEYALKNNYENKIATKNIDAAKARKWEVTTIGLPQISGKVDYQNWLKQQVSLLDTGVFSTGESTGVYSELIFTQKQTLNPSLTLTQLIFDGSYLVALQSAKTYLKISELAKEKTTLVTREAVVNAYGNVLVATKTLHILESNRKVLEKNLNETQKIFENGLTEEENVEQLQITLGNLDNNIRNTERLKEIAYQMLNLTLGQSINQKLILTDTLESLSVQNSSLELLAKTFDINKHIDYRVLLNTRKTDALLLKLEKSKYLPTLAAYVNYGANHFFRSYDVFDAASSTTNEKSWFDYSLFGVSLNVPIFSSFGRKAKVKQAKIALDNSDIKLEQVKQQLNLQAAAAKSEYQLSIENYETAKKNLALAERIEKKQQIKFFEGLSSSFDLSQAQNQLYTQQSNYVQSMLNVIAKKAQLENALNLPVKK